MLVDSSEPSPNNVNPAVAEALNKVAEAMAVAEETAQKVDKLPSARVPTIWTSIYKTMKPILQITALLGYSALIHAFHATSQAIGGLFLALIVASYGYRKSSLSASGAVAAALIGWATLAPSFRAGLVLLSFFFVSSKFTELGEDEKDVDDSHKGGGGQRDWRQVACNGLIPAILTIAAGVITGGMDGTLRPATAPVLTALYAGFMGYFGCCCGDTWASELGQLSPEEPRLITTLRPVRKGTNGGVTWAGLGASVAGGLFIGIAFYTFGVLSPSSNTAAAIQQWKLIPLGLAAGLVGSIIDSILGATVQFTGFNRRTGKITGKTGPDVTPISGLAVLDNNLVNAVSATFTAALTALVALRLF
jgi:uncharacterized protein (TIGR00297 family)